VPPGDARGSGGGLIANCDARLETVADVRRDSEPDAGCVLDGLLVMAGRGEPDTVFRSGAMVVFYRLLVWFLVLGGGRGKVGRCGGGRGCSRTWMDRWRKVHQRSARATERGSDVHLLDMMIFADVLAPNAYLRFIRNLLADSVCMVLVGYKRSLLSCRPVHSMR
jgi:hypothetical protein